MEIAFFCSTPYQIINAVNIKRNDRKKDAADIYVLNHFQSCAWMLDRLKDSRIFRNTFIVEDGDFDYRYDLPMLRRYIKKSIDFMTCKHVICHYIRTDLAYDMVYYTFPNMLIEFACYYYIQKNKNIKFCMFEDGFSSYSDDLLAISDEKARFLKITGREQFLDENQELYLYAPDLFIQRRKNKRYTVKPMPKLDVHDSETIEIYNGLFEFEQENVIAEDIIFFEQPYEQDSINEEIRKILDITLSKIDCKEICVKIHPRGCAEKYGDVRTYINSTIPAEVIYMNMDRLENKTLISSVSTACLSPKLIFNQEPRLILLYKFLHLEEKGIISSELVKFAEKVVLSYKDKSKVMIPENEQELLSCLASIKQRE